MSLSSVPHFFGFVNRKCNLSTVFLNGNSGCDFPARETTTRVATKIRESEARRRPAVVGAAAGAFPFTSVMTCFFFFRGVGETSNLISLFPLFSLPFPASQAEKSNLISLFPLFSLPFPTSQAKKGNLISHLPLFPLPFPTSQAEKGNPISLFPLFPLPFPTSQAEKSNLISLFPLFSLPF